MALKNFNTFPLLEEYLNYLTVIKGRSPNTVVEYRTDILMFFSYRIAKAQAGNRRNKSKKNCIHPAILEISQTKAKVIENNVSEELETQKISERMPKHSSKLSFTYQINTGSLFRETTLSSTPLMLHQ